MVLVKAVIKLLEERITQYPILFELGVLQEIINKI